MARTGTRKRAKRKKKGLKGKQIFQSLVIALLIIGCVKFCEALDNIDNGQHETLGCDDVGNLMLVKTNQALKSIEKRYKGMDVSFNPQYHIPNWVSWELTKDETSGDVSRTNKFYADPDVEGSAESWDYNYSGYDRGHMAPAGDMKWDKDAMAETFYMTNICPQVKSLNTGTWKRLEEKCRYWAEIDGSLYIVCGPVIDGDPVEYIGDSRVYVPKRFFKVILSPYSNPARGIGFIIPNGKVKGGMQECAVPIDSVEALTGHDFFSSLPDDIENDVESQCNFHYWSTLRKNKKLTDE